VALSSVHCGTERDTEARVEAEADRDRPTANQNADRCPDTCTYGDAE